MDQPKARASRERWRQHDLVDRGAHEWARAIRMAESELTLTKMVGPVGLEPTTNRL